MIERSRTPGLGKLVSTTFGRNSGKINLFYSLDLTIERPGIE